MDITERLTSFIRSEFLAKSGADEVGPKDSLLDSGLIDSTGIFELVGFVEKTFGIDIPDEEIVPEHFDTIEQLAAYVGTVLEKNRSESAAG